MKISKVSDDLSSLKFKEVEFKEVTIKDLIKAERISGKNEGLEFSLALLSQVATFDGKKLVPEDLEAISTEDFLLLSQELIKPNVNNSINQ